MDRIVEALVERLVGIGVEMNNIPAFLRNLASTISVNPHISLQELNRRMEFLGWGALELDDYTLQLILASLEGGASLKPAGPFGPSFNPDAFLVAERLKGEASTH